jgi:hypothetical protein
VGDSLKSGSIKSEDLDECDPRFARIVVGPIWIADGNSQCQANVVLDKTRIQQPESGIHSVFCLLYSVVLVSHPSIIPIFLLFSEAPRL